MKFKDFIYLIDWCTKIRLLDIHSEIIKIIDLVYYIDCDYNIYDDFQEYLNYDVVHIIPTDTYCLDITIYHEEVKRNYEKE